MSMELTNRSRYLVIIDKIKQDIEQGILQQGEQLPSEYNLAKTLGVSRTTLREALRILEEENIVIRRHGIGTFINKKPIFHSGIEELTSVTDMIIKEGKKPGTSLLFSDYAEPIDEDRKELKLGSKELVYLVKRVRTADDKPMVYCIDKIPSSLIPPGSKLTTESIFSFIEDTASVSISYATAVIETIGYHDEISEILECEQGTPLLVLKQTHYDLNDQPVLYSINFFRADTFSFSVFRKRVKL
ncbi:GntR family transcriptional regulator [Caldalkalibacillus mannanilyticus]|uniref:GntR family transcriptional regulator n=1 Tax=Caldalkalibacillus mannanilyticus TaxID=1418 RepID=UPI00046AE06F|nr:GntR family transcriptional regulator [Caldalkalibacillus mannanilyticus]